MAAYLHKVDSKAAANTEKVAAPQRYFVTLSSSGGKLLYHKQGQESDEVMLYDGTDTVFISNRVSQEKRPIRISTILHGIQINGLLGFPLPALSIPYVPLTLAAVPPGITLGTGQVEGQSPVFHRVPTASLTLDPSTTKFARIDNMVAVTACILRDGSFGTDQRWDYQSYAGLRDSWVAKDMTFTDYQGYIDSNGGSRRDPEVILKYHLIQYQSASLPAPAFDLTTRLSAGDVVEDHRGSPPVAFSFTPHQSLEQQIKRALWDQQRRNSEIKHGSIGGSGIFILGSLGLLMGAWFWRRQHSDAMQKDAGSRP